jgi:3-hydroxyisobutyrate dehydrogenase-like beta-hydroxyacid dehydrogenase
MSEALAAGRATVGIVGLGILGLAHARNLRAAGFAVTGCDVVPEATAALAACAGAPLADGAEVAAASDAAPVALASRRAIDEAVLGPRGVAAGVRQGTVVGEMGTFPLPDKEAVRAALEARGGRVLDCPVSGAGAQAAVRDLVVFASGDAGAFEAFRPVFEGFARDVRHVGPFGDGMTIKIAANLLVTIHTLAMAEALHLAERSGPDLDTVYEAVRTGAGGSRMFDLRAPLMIRGAYQPATMKMDVYQKDLALIVDHARETRSATPLTMAALPFYAAALAQGRDKDDTAALFEVLRAMGRAQ